MNIERRDIKLLLAVGVFFIVAMIFASIWGSGFSSKSVGAFPVKISEPERPTILTGQVYRMRLTPGETTPVAIDERSYDEMVQAVSSHDTEGFVQLTLKGRVFWVPDLTRVRVIDTGFFKVKVRILEGNNYGESGWVARERIVD